MDAHVCSGTCSHKKTKYKQIHNVCKMNMEFSIKTIHQVSYTVCYISILTLDTLHSGDISLVTCDM